MSAAEDVGLRVAGSWIEALRDPETRAALEARLPAYVTARRWFRGKSRAVTGVALAHAIAVPVAPPPASSSEDAPPAALAILRVTYGDAAGPASDEYALPLAFVAGDHARAVARESPHLVVSPLQAAGVDGVLCDAVGDARALEAILALTLSSASLAGDGATLRFRRVSADPPAENEPHARGEGAPDHAAPRAIHAEQTNTSVVYGDAYILKIVRRLDEGTSPDLEMGEWLTAAGYAHAPPVVGAAEVVREGRAPATLAILHRFVPNQGDAWAFTLGVIARFLDGVEGRELPPSSRAGVDLHARAAAPLPSDIESLLEGGGARVRLLGGRIAEMHLALAAPQPSGVGDATFARFEAEPLEKDERTRLSGAARASLAQVFSALTARLGAKPEDSSRALPPDARALVAALLPRRAEIEARLDRFVELAAAPAKTRVHGDLHLGQVLFTGEDFVIIDFEGEPARALEERTSKRSPLADVAGMLRSLHYASVSAARAHPLASSDASIAHAATSWHDAASAAFLGAYLARARRGPEPARHLPDDAATLRAVLDFYLLEKCIYELRYEIDNRPDWVAIPAAGLAQLLEEPDAR